MGASSSARTLALACVFVLPAACFRFGLGGGGSDDDDGDGTDGHGGACEWTELSDAPDLDIGFGIAAGPATDLYVVGVTHGDLEAHQSLTHFDGFLIKWDMDGVLQWTRQIGTDTNDETTGVAVGEPDHVYVGGSTHGSIDGQADPPLIDEDGFVALYDESGTNLWIRQLGASAPVTGVAADATGVYAVGNTWEGFDTPPSGLAADAYLVKYDPGGTRQWVVQFTEPGYPEPRAVTTDGAGAVYVVGYGDGVFLSRYDADGTELWTERLPSGDPTGVATDAEGGVYVVGGAGGELPGETSSGGTDAFVVKFDADGVHQWSVQYGTSTYDRGTAVTVDDQGAVYVTGVTGGALDGETPAGGDDVFVSGFDPDGSKLWTRLIATPEGDRSWGIVMGEPGTLYVAGEIHTDTMLSKLCFE